MTKIVKTILNLLKLKKIKAVVELEATIITAKKDKKTVITLLESCGFEEFKEDDIDDFNDDEVTYVNKDDVQVVVAEDGSKLSLAFYE
jgi:hypothetical protein